MSKRVNKRRVIRLILKLLPILLHFKADRKEWVKKEGKGVNEHKMRKHAIKAVNTFITLGPLFIKLGQWLSTRADLLPQPWLEEFTKLQDDVPPAPFEEIKPIIEKELNCKIVDAYEYFGECISGASLGQVYKARYNGMDVVVKVNRPNIEAIIEEDINILKRLLPLVTKFIDKNISFTLESMFNQFVESIYEEIDYRIEAENLLRIKDNLKGEPIIIPDLIKERSTKKVLTLGYIPGIKITDVKALDNINIDKTRLVITIHRLFFKMLLKHDIFHADPHPGNLAVTQDGKVILYDFGMVGRLNQQTRLKLIRLYLALINKDPSRTVDILLSLNTLAPDANRYVIEKAIELSIKALYGTKVDEMEVKALTELANKTMSKFPFRLPKELALYIRMATILEGIYLSLNVDFKFVKVLSSLLEEEGLMREAYIEEFRDSIERISKGLTDTITLVPLIRSYIEHNTLYNSTNNKRYALISTSIISSSLFISSSILMQSNQLFAIILFVIAIAIIISSFLFKLI